MGRGRGWGEGLRSRCTVALGGAAAGHCVSYRQGVEQSLDGPRHAGGRITTMTTTDVKRAPASSLSLPQCLNFLKSPSDPWLTLLSGLAPYSLLYPSCTMRSIREGPTSRVYLAAWGHGWEGV